MNQPENATPDPENVPPPLLDERVALASAGTEGNLQVVRLGPVVAGPPGPGTPTVSVQIEYESGAADNWIGRDPGRRYRIRIDEVE